MAIQLNLPQARKKTVCWLYWTIDWLIDWLVDQYLKILFLPTIPGFAAPSSPTAFTSPAIGISQQYAATHELDPKASWQGCPNKCNPYHVCAEYCRQRWGMGYAEPEKYTEKKRQLMLLKYPKPAGWKEIYDPGTYVIWC